MLLGAAVPDCPHTQTDELLDAIGEALVATDRPRRRGRVLARLGVSAIVLALAGVLAGVGTMAAFSDTTENAPNLFESGRVEIAGNDAGSAMFELQNIAPGEPESRCIAVTYSGTLAAGVVLYGESTGDLAQYLDVTVERGTGGGDFPGCTGYDPLAAVHVGDLAAWPTDYASGITETLTWEPGDTWVYRFTVTLRDGEPDAQGLTASQRFTWEARNT